MDIVTLIVVSFSFSSGILYTPQHLCPKVVPTIIGHSGGFAERIRAQWPWVLPLPEKLDASAAGPLMCGGITVFSKAANKGVTGIDPIEGRGTKEVHMFTEGPKDSDKFDIMPDRGR